MAYFLGGTFGASTLQSTLVDVDSSYDPVYSDPVSAEFIWNLLPSAYRKLMDDREVFTHAWEAMIRVISGKLLETWEAGASYSLRDVPVQQQRKWILYDFIKEINFDEDPSLNAIGIKDRFVWSEESFELSGRWVNRHGHDKATTSLRGSSTQDGSLSWSVKASFDEVEIYAAAQFGYFNSSEKDALANAIVIGVVADSDGALLPFLGHYSGAGFLTQSTGSYELTLGTEYRLSGIYEARDRVLSFDLYEVGATKVSGTGGTDSTDSSDIYTSGFSDSSQDFDESDVLVGDMLVIDGDEYQISEVAGDTLVVGSASLPAGVSNIPYSIKGEIKRLSMSLDILNLASDSTFEVNEFGTSNLDLQRVSSSTGDTLFGPSAPTALPVGVQRKSLSGSTSDWTYFDPGVSEDLLSAPILQDAVTDPEYFLYEGTDFDIVDSSFQFQEPPSEALWAEYSTYDEGVLYGNFGVNVGLEGSASGAYRSQIRGLYHSFFRGPTLGSIRSGVQILLGLPFAEKAGEVESINEAYSGLYGEITVAGKGYLYPLITGTSLSVGDEVSIFQPLCDGVEIQDYISDPLWFEPTEMGLMEIEKFHTFGVFLDVDAFDISDLSVTSNFVDLIAPTWKDELYVVYKNLRDQVSIDEVLTLVITLNLYDIPCDEPPLIAYDDTIYEGEEADWKYDQGVTDWEETSAAMRATGKIYNSAQLQAAYADSEIRYYLTGTAYFTNGSSSVPGTGTAWTTEVGSGAVTDTYVALSRVTSGSDGESTEDSNVFEDSVTGFSSLEEGDTIEIDGTEYQIQTLSAPYTQATLDAPLPTTDTGVSWTATGTRKIWGEVASITDDSNLVLDVAFSGTSGTYKLTLLDPGYLEAFYDYFTEQCPEEEFTIVLDISPGYQETLLVGTATFSELSTGVTGSGTDWVAGIGGPGVVVDKYVVDNEGTWYLVDQVVDADDLTLISAAGKDLSDTTLHLATQVLAGNLTFTNGVATVACSSSLTGVVGAGDWIQSVPGDEPVVEVLSIDGAGTTITLVSSYSGNSGATKAIHRGTSVVLPLSASLPGGPQNFTDWYGTVGGQLTETISEPIP